MRLQEITRRAASQTKIWLKNFPQKAGREFSTLINTAPEYSIVTPSCHGADYTEWKSGLIENKTNAYKIMKKFILNN